MSGTSFDNSPFSDKYGPFTAQNSVGPAPKHKPLGKSHRNKETCPRFYITPSNRLNGTIGSYRETRTQIPMFLHLCHSADLINHYRAAAGKGKKKKNLGPIL